MRIDPRLLAAFGAAAVLAACGHNTEQRAATGAGSGAVAGAVGGAGGTAVSKNQDASSK